MPYLNRIENWKRYGKTKVARDEKGRFVSWQRIFEVFTGKKIALYGYCRTRNGTYPARYEFYGGTGRDLRRCVAIASKLPPKRRYTTVNVIDFLNDPYRYGTEGYWFEKSVDS